MIAYSFDELGNYVGQYICQANPLVIGEFLLPHNATLIQPPEVKKGEEIASFANGEWQVREIEKAKQDEAEVEITKRLTPEEKKEAALDVLRVMRNHHLQLTDFALLSDAPQSIKDKLPEIIEYRRKLRDITKTILDPTQHYELPVSPI